MQELAEACESKTLTGATKPTAIQIDIGVPCEREVSPLQQYVYTQIVFLSSMKSKSASSKICMSRAFSE
jgi:hypothetical protein